MKTKNPIPENKVDELKALIARSILIKIEQKKIEEKLHEIAKYYDEDSLKSIHEPIGFKQKSLFVKVHMSSMCCSYSHKISKDSHCSNPSQQESSLIPTTKQI